jgi:hypothetical protein
MIVQKITGQTLFELLEKMTPEQRQHPVMLFDSGVYSPATEVKFQILYPSFGGYSNQPMRGAQNIEEPNSLTLKAD